MTDTVTVTLTAEEWRMLIQALTTAPRVEGTLRDGLLKRIDIPTGRSHLLADARAIALPPLPTAYRWLDGYVGLSRILIEARATFGTLETKGPGNNPVILAWAKEVGLEKVYRHDETAWCGLAMAVWAKRAGWEVVKDPLWARNWINFGRRVEDGDEALGDVLVFTREGGGGHVGEYVGEDDSAFHVLGGNQGDAVSIVRIAKHRLIGARRPTWRTSQQPGVVKVRLKASGELSENEA